MFSRSYTINNRMTAYSGILDLAQDVVEDTSVLEVSDFWVSVESADHIESLARASLHLDILADLKVATLHVDVEGLFTGQTVSVSVLAILELKGKNTHTNEIGSVNALVRLSNDSLDSLEIGTLGGPVSA